MAVGMLFARFHWLRACAASFCPDAMLLLLSTGCLGL